MEGAGRVSSQEAFEPALGWRSREVEQELPELQIMLAEARVGQTGDVTAASPTGVKARLQV